ncbi:MAG: type 3 dihydrofolate reductase [Gammaproteobacteria bacterium]|nr:type 3 dihydrofolate reductase [Gammaproteobacteria bacterium]
MKISLIAAMAEDRVIGIDNKLPWNLPADLAWFKKNTLNKPIVMGRKTWESLPFKPLPGRDNIIITRDKSYQATNKQNEVISSAIICQSIDEAIEYAKKEKHEELMFIGGATLYEQVLERTDCLYLTKVKGQFEGDAWFPEIDYSCWQEDFFQDNEPDEKNKHFYRFSIYNRI